jgi:Bacterial type II and III secretion system protein
MAGLIGERDEDLESKVPVLGDIPGLGFFFRSKLTDRRKTETLIFVEARVLDSDPCAARQESFHDFLLGQPYVWGELLDNPLEEGLHRVGFGPYLPPLSVHEARYWERLGRKVRKICTKLDDATE